MSIRIRYFNTREPNVIESVKKYQHPTNGARYKIRINDKELRFFVIEDSADIVITEGRASNLHQVKINAKKALTNLGIEFSNEETRSRKAKETTEQVTE